MHLYMSGTPRNDAYQSVENRLCTHRLFSLHGDYEKACLRWLEDVRSGIFTAEDYFAAYPNQRDLVMGRDIARREKQRMLHDTRDWNTLEVIERVCQQTQRSPYPRFILLDSGAFTAWNKGDEVSVDEVMEKYSRFIEGAGDLFDEIWMINLDKIPGERGRDPTVQELTEAVEISDRNFEILTKEFGDKVLPVFHQGEAKSRLFEVIEQVRGKSNYICVSPRNDVAEPLRVAWSSEYHSYIAEYDDNIRTHGLATTGNKMIRTVPWYSGDSAAWVQHGGYGMVDIFHNPTEIQTRAHGHYTNYFVSIDQTHIDEANYGDRIGGQTEAVNKFYDRCSHGIQQYIAKRVESYGFPFACAQWDSRVRNLICMGELARFAEWAQAEATKTTAVGSLFGGFDGLES